MIEKYQEEFGRLPKPPTEWLGSIRQSAMERFVKNGFPTMRMEQWKDTNLSSITEKFFPVSEGKAKTFDTKLNFWKDFPHVVFYNGKVTEIATKDSKANIRPFDTAIASASEIFQPVFDLHPKTQNAFYDLNTSMVQQGVGIHIPKNEILVDPLYLVYVSDDQGSAHYFRNLIVLESGAQAQVVELYLEGSNPSTSLTIPVTQIKVGQNAKLDHIKYQAASTIGSHVSVCVSSLLSDSKLRTYSFSFGGLLTRNDIHVTLDDPGAECFMDGLYVASGKQTVDHHTLVDHAKPHCSSSETYKGILLDHAHGIFEGKIKVDTDAQKTDAKQLNQNLLLSKDARINTAPQLEILADDVKCSHGATIGKLDENQIFYMRSRGIDLKTAREILIQSYAQEIISNVKIPELAAEIQSALLEKIKS